MSLRVNGEIRQLLTMIPVTETLIRLPLVPQACAMVLNGARSGLSLDAVHGGNDWQAYEQVIVTDGAWDDFSHTTVGQFLLTHHADCLTVLGDGDSIRQRPCRFIETPDQNFTDFDKALQHAIQTGITHADVYWAGGGEIDHCLGNLSVAAKYAPAIQLRFLTEQQSYYYFAHAISPRVVIHGAKNHIISLYPFPEANVSSQGLRYPLNELYLTQHSQQSLRNQADSESVVIELLSGSIWLFVGLGIIVV